LSAKKWGESPPVRLSPSQAGALAALFAEDGKLNRLRKRLNTIRPKPVSIHPALGTIACIDDQLNIYVGLEFLAQNMDNDAVLAGVLAHEWGHACAEAPTSGELAAMSWEQIFELRRAHETLADEIAGRLLFHLGLPCEPLIDFITQATQTPSHHYHAPDLRGRIIQFGFRDEEKKSALARQMFSGTGYQSPFVSKLYSAS
jgi:hypothetical protein